MDSKKISALLLSVERGSLTSAAAELGYTQSGLTHMMNALENELGLSLLIRNKNGVHLSPAGQTLLPKMNELIAAADALEQEAERLRQRSYTTLRLGAYSSVSAGWLPSILAEFHRADPNTEVLIDVGGVQDLYEKLRSDQLDCAIVSLQDSLCQGLHYIHLADDPLVAVLPESDRHRDFFPITDYAGSEFLMPSDGFDMDIAPLLNRHLGKSQPHIRTTGLSDSGIVSMVEHGLGVSLLSELIMKDMPQSVRSLPLSPAVSRRLGIAVSGRHVGEKVFRRFLRCAQLVIDDMYTGSRAV